MTKQSRTPKERFLKSGKSQQSSLNGPPQVKASQSKGNPPPPPPKQKKD